MEYRRELVFKIPAMTVEEMSELLGTGTAAVLTNVRKGNFDFLKMGATTIILLTPHTRSNMKPRGNKTRYLTR